jgi:hypothetical protein
MYPWGNTQTVRTAAYAVGDRIRSGRESVGTVVSLDGEHMQVSWDDGNYGPITYPMDAGYLRKEMPWERTPSRS